MTQSQWTAIDQLIGEMTEAEKRELVARLTRSRPQISEEEEVRAQRKALDELEAEMDKLPDLTPDDGFTSADHDKVLYSRPA
jgi:hypothetical protein